MEELTIEIPDSESAVDDMDVLSEVMEPDTEAALSEADEDPDEGDHEPEPDENEGEAAEFLEDVESDTDKSSDSDTAPGEDSGDSEQYPEKTEHPDSGSETVSGNSADYPYGSDADDSTYAAYETGEAGSLLLVETLEKQNDILYAGFMSTLFILGIILGILIMHGFRLRRV